MNQVNKPLIIIGDLGAGTNIIKNLLILDHRYNFFDNHTQDRKSKIFSLYPRKLKNNLHVWLTTEYTTRTWQSLYGIDLSDNINVNNVIKVLDRINGAVFINHSAFYQHKEVLQLQKHFNLVYILPKTLNGLQWQIKSYAEKITVDNLHNFTTSSDAERTTLINKHGMKIWNEMNLTNMFYICKQRRASFYQFAKCNNIKTIPLEFLLTPKKHIKLYELFVNMFEYTVNKSTFIELLSTWLNLHDSPDSVEQEQWIKHNITVNN